MLPPDALGALAPVQHPGPFTHEGPSLYQAAYERNKPFARPGPYQTKLGPKQEAAFRIWLAQKKVPFDPDAHVADYDMRGFWKATHGRGWRPGNHFPDTYKTPYDTTFSRESKYAKPNTPFVWKGNRLVDTRTDTVAFHPPRESQSPDVLAMIQKMLQVGR